jgi:hypothetical protein
MSAGSVAHTMRDANAEPNVVPPTTPPFCQRFDCLTHFKRQ